MMYNFIMSGGGTKFIDDWFMAGGRSKDTVGVSFPYAVEATDDVLHGKVEKYCSTKTAEIMANRAFLNARKLGFQDDACGIGVTCSLNKFGERADRVNKFCYAMINNNGYVSSEIIIDKRLYPDRKSQEVLLSFTLHALIKSDVMMKFKYGAINQCGNIKAIYPGSFNPIHEAHRSIKRSAEMILQTEVAYEVTIDNFDKSKLTDFGSFIGVVTTAPLFLDKVKLLGPNKTFVVGFDTYQRLIENISADDLAFFENTNTSFLVFHRIINGQCSSQLGFKDTHFVKFVDTKIHPSSDLSSSQLRKQNGQDNLIQRHLFG